MVRFSVCTKTGLGHFGKAERGHFVREYWYQTLGWSLDGKDLFVLRGLVPDRVKKIKVNKGLTMRVEFGSNCDHNLIHKLTVNAPSREDVERTLLVLKFLYMCKRLSAI